MANNKYDTRALHEVLGKPEVHVILAATPQGHIGYKNTIPWKLKGDLKRFKEITMNHIVFMGRNTYESLGRALEGRDVVVISESLGAEHVARGVEAWRTIPLMRGRYGEKVMIARSFGIALAYAAGAISADSDVGRETKIFVAGGVQMYQEALEIAKYVHLTLVHKRPDGDKWLEDETAEKNKARVEGWSRPLEINYDAWIPNFHLCDFAEVEEDGVILNDTNDGQNIPIISHSYHLFMRPPVKQEVDSAPAKHPLDPDPQGPSVE